MVFVPLDATGSYWCSCLELGSSSAIWLQPKGSKEFELKAEGSEIEITILGICSFLNYVKLMLPSWNIIFLFCQIPGQKMAQRDSAGLQDLFSLACFMTWLVPKMEVQLGAGSEVLSKIMETWELGCLGWCNVGEWITKKRNIPACVMLRCQSSVVFKFRTTFALLKKINIIGYPNIKDFEFPSPPKPYSLYCGIWKPRYSGTIT